jgi:hypothetical protein
MKLFPNGAKPQDEAGTEASQNESNIAKSPVFTGLIRDSLS